MPYLSKVLDKKNIFRLSDKKIKSFGFSNVSHLIENKLEGYLHSGKLCQSLLQMVQQSGVTVLNSIEIKGHEQIGEHVVLYTNQHVHLTCSKLLGLYKWICETIIAGIEPCSGEGTDTCNF